jgi:hypothetical protein
MRALALSILLLASLAGLWLSTEYAAVHLLYASGLRPPWIILGSLHLYAPWAWLA